MIYCSWMCFTDFTWRLLTADEIYLHYILLLCIGGNLIYMHKYTFICVCIYTCSQETTAYLSYYWNIFTNTYKKIYGSNFFFKEIVKEIQFRLLCQWKSATVLVAYQVSARLPTQNRISFLVSVLSKHSFRLLVFRLAVRFAELL